MCHVRHAWAGRCSAARRAGVLSLLPLSWPTTLFLSVAVSRRCIGIASVELADISSWATPRWLNLYGAPDTNKEKALRERMNAGDTRGTTFRGRVLLQINAELDGQAAIIGEVGKPEARLLLKSEKSSRKASKRRAKPKAATPKAPGTVPDPVLGQLKLSVLHARKLKNFGGKFGKNDPYTEVIYGAERGPDGKTLRTKTKKGVCVCV